MCHYLQHTSKRQTYDCNTIITDLHLALVEGSLFLHHDQKYHFTCGHIAVECVQLLHQCVFYCIFLCLFVIQKGNIFLCDYKSLEGLQTLVVEGNSMPLTAALCLLYLDTTGTLKPIAIQVMTHLGNKIQWVI